MKWLRKINQALRDYCEDDSHIQHRVGNVFRDWRSFNLRRRLTQFIVSQARLWPRRKHPERFLSEIIQLKPELEAAHGMSEFRFLAPPQNIEIHEDRYTGLLSQTNYFELAPISYKTPFVCQLKNAKIHIGEGVLLTPKNALVLDSAFAPYRLASTTIYGSVLPGSTSNLEGHYSSVWGIFASNIFHWLVDCLPRLHSLELAGTQALTLLMPVSATTYHRESLACCLPDGMDVLYLGNLGWTEVSDFVFPSYVTRAQFAAVPKEYSEVLRQRVWTRLGLEPSNQKSKRIYVSRRNSAHRRVLNETAVLGCLEQWGFESYVLEELSFRQQVELFYNAEIVVGPHGAGLANILFSPKAKVIEFQPSHIALHYFFLSQSLTQEYIGIVCPPRPDSKHLVVPIRELEAALSSLL